jgi:3-phosphoshikimate 1-carboxyvinyltransferase
MVTIERISVRDCAVTVPPSKAHTLRALVLASLAEGRSRVANPLLGDDQLHLIECLRALGVSVTLIDGGTAIEIAGSGGHFSPIAESLDCGESGVAMNFLSSLVPFSSRKIALTGKEGLLRRPVDEIVSGVRQLGGRVDFAREEGFPPLLASPSGLTGGVARMKGAKTSQYFSSLAIASALASSDVRIECVDEMSERPYFDITVEMMRRFGVEARNEGYKTIRVRSGQRYRPCDLTVESDYSSASYFIAAASITGATVTLKGLSRETAQGDRKIIDYARSFGGSLEWKDDVLVASGRGTVPIDESFTDTPDLVPTVAAMAAFAEGTSRLRDVARLKFKECDRVAAIIEGLARVGISSRVSGDDLLIEGNPSAVKAGDVRTFGDHRIAMSFAVAGLAAGGITLDDETCVKKSFPDFWSAFRVFYE